MSYHGKILADWTEEDFKEYEADYQANLFALLESDYED